MSHWTLLGQPIKTRERESGGGMRESENNRVELEANSGNNGASAGVNLFDQFKGYLWAWMESRGRN